MYPDGTTQADLDRFIQNAPEEEMDSVLVGEYPLTDAEIALIVGRIKATCTTKGDELCPF